MPCPPIPSYPIPILSLSTPSQIRNQNQNQNEGAGANEEEIEAVDVSGCHYWQWKHAPRNRMGPLRMMQRNYSSTVQQRWPARARRRERDARTTEGAAAQDGHREMRTGGTCQGVFVPHTPRLKWDQQQHWDFLDMPPSILSDRYIDIVESLSVTAASIQKEKPSWELSTSMSMIPR